MRVAQEGLERIEGSPTKVTYDDIKDRFWGTPESSTGTSDFVPNVIYTWSWHGLRKYVVRLYVSPKDGQFARSSRNRDTLSIRHRSARLTPIKKRPKPAVPAACRRRNTMQSIVGLVLGGGKALASSADQLRTKPAVPVAGKYRLIDIPISNCINSGMNRIYVLTQFLASACTGTSPTPTSSIPSAAASSKCSPPSRPTKATDWYQGTADAVRQQLRYVEEPWIEDVLILSGDQLYRMDFRRLLETHAAKRPT